MALRPENREDLMREAKAFPQRLLFKMQPSVAHPAVVSPVQELFVGFRRDGAFSVYVDQEVVLQFNAAGRLRRLFVEDRKFAAKNGGLEELIRESGQRVQLERRPLEATDEHELLARCRAIIAACLAQTGSSDCEAFPAAGAEELRELATEKLHAVAAGIQVADSL